MNARLSQGQAYALAQPVDLRRRAPEQGQGARLQPDHGAGRGDRQARRRVTLNSRHCYVQVLDHGFEQIGFRHEFLRCQVLSLRKARSYVSFAASSTAPTTDRGQAIRKADERTAGSQQ